MEIERKFLVTDLSKLDLNKYASKSITQDYIYVDALSIIRKRKIIQGENTKYIYTIKTGKKGISVEEIEYEITKDQYNSLIPNSKFITIDKVRYIIPYENNLKIELDVFDGEYAGICFAEIEFKSEEDAFNTQLPIWFGKELTNKVTNSMMATGSREEILKLLDSIKD